MAVIQPIKTTKLAIPKEEKPVNTKVNSYDVVTPFQRDLQKRVPSSAYIVILLSILACSTGFANTMYNPAILEVAKEYGTDFNHIQAISAQYLLGLGIGQLFWGPICDRFGRRKSLMAACFASMVVNFIFISTHTYSQLEWARVLQGLAFSSFGVIPTAILRDIYSARQFTVFNSWVSIFFLMSPAFAPLIGGYIIISLKWIWIFNFVSAMVMLCGLFYLFTLPETLDDLKRQKLQPKIIARNYWTIVRDPQSLVAIFLAAFVAMVLLSWTTLSAAIFIKAYGVSPQNFGYYSLIPVIFTVIANKTNSNLVARYNPQRILVISTLFQFLMIVIDLIVSFWFLGPWGLVIASACNMFFTGYQNGDLMSIFLLKYTHMVATASAFFLALRTVIIATLLYIVAFLPLADGRTYLYFNIICISVSTILVLLYNTLWPAPGARIYRLRMQVIRRKHNKMSFKLFYII